MPRGRRPNAVLWPEWVTSFRKMLPDERAEYARRREFDIKVGKATAKRMRVLQSLHAGLPSMERAEADTMTRRVEG